MQTIALLAELFWGILFVLFLVSAIMAYRQTETWGEGAWTLLIIIVFQIMFMFSLMGIRSLAKNCECTQTQQQEFSSMPRW